MHFELVLPNGNIKRVTDHRMRNAMADVALISDVDVRHRAGQKVVKHYLDIIRVNMLPNLPIDTEVYLVMGSKINDLYNGSK